MNINKLKGKIVENGQTIESLAREMGIDRASLYRKLQNDGKTMLIRDANNIAEILHLSASDALAIFFNQTVACDATNEPRM